MKKLLWTSAMALTAVACLTACDDSSSGASNSVPSYKTEAALPDTCEMEVAKAGDTYFACFENEWVEVTDSATVEKIKEGLDEKELKEQLEELEEKLEEAAAAAKKPSSSSKKVASSADADEGDVTPESSASEEECTGRRCGTGNSSSSKKSSGGSGNGGSGSGEGGSGSGSSSDSGVGSSDSDEESSSSDKSSSSVKNSSSSVNNSSSSVNNSSSSKGNSSSSVNNSSSSKGNSSSSVAASSSSVDMCKGKSWTTSQFCDSRDGQIYKKVTIGKQTWMAENLNYETASGSYCIPNVVDYCDTYGRLYDWSTAMSTTNPVCPDGWRIPSLEDYKTLIVSVDDDHTAYSSTNNAAVALRSTTGWDRSADNTSGFSLLKAGRRDEKGGFNKEAAQVLASDDEYSYLLVNDVSDNAWANEYTNATFARSVRCIKK